MSEEHSEGWNWPANARKWHYFTANGIALCGKWMIWPDHQPHKLGNDESPENCAACRRVLEKHSLTAAYRAKATGRAATRPASLIEPRPEPLQTDKEKGSSA